ncbi:hypothetical protein MAPG_05082 [Magnaporthiopsis poae ATCC 64411]|uniref:Uncharacterized protein n=1 Tax=Magnaporthiopsis poae (strain ATCC 64411 / 73-15) TaxID=644358 RepID=A0A0C4DYG1_MAGP6|nr:hypothetical protein MAPG_05082 [Magnaporthiopsis poae ATCC 64411]
MCWDAWNITRHHRDAIERREWRTAAPVVGLTLVHREEAGAAGTADVAERMEEDAGELAAATTGGEEYQRGGARGACRLFWRGKVCSCAWEGGKVAAGGGGGERPSSSVRTWSSSSSALHDPDGRRVPTPNRIRPENMNNPSNPGGGAASAAVNPVNQPPSPAAHRSARYRPTPVSVAMQDDAGRSVEMLFIRGQHRTFFPDERRLVREFVRCWNRGVVSREAKAPYTDACSMAAVVVR